MWCEEINAVHGDTSFETAYITNPAWQQVLNRPVLNRPLSSIDHNRELDIPREFSSAEGAEVFAEGAELSAPRGVSLHLKLLRRLQRFSEQLILNRIETQDLSYAGEAAAVNRRGAKFFQ